MSSKRKSDLIDNPPQPPLKSGYMLFQQEHRENEIKKNPELDFIQLSKVLGKKWTDSNEQTKAVRSTSIDPPHVRLQFSIAICFLIFSDLFRNTRRSAPRCI